MFTTNLNLASRDFIQKFEHRKGPCLQGVTKYLHIWKRRISAFHKRRKRDSSRKSRERERRAWIQHSLFWSPISGGNTLQVKSILVEKEPQCLKWKCVLTSCCVLTIMKSGEANMEMSEATLKYPTKGCRTPGSKTLTLTNTMITNRTKTASSNPVIFSCNKHPGDDLRIRFRTTKV